MNQTRPNSPCPIQVTWGASDLRTIRNKIKPEQEQYELQPPLSVTQRHMNILDIIPQRTPQAIQRDTEEILAKQNNQQLERAYKKDMHDWNNSVDPEEKYMKLLIIAKHYKSIRNEII